jgi:hypothetical protein
MGLSWAVLINREISRIMDIAYDSVGYAQWEEMIFGLRLNRRSHPTMCESSEGIRAKEAKMVKEHVGLEPIGKRTLNCLHSFSKHAQLHR